jgi:hypothetical protein
MSALFEVGSAPAAHAWLVALATPSSRVNGESNIQASVGGKVLLMRNGTVGKKNVELARRDRPNAEAVPDP